MKDGRVLDVRQLGKGMSQSVDSNPNGNADEENHHPPKPWDSDWISIEENRYEVKAEDVCGSCQEKIFQCSTYNARGSKVVL